MNVLNHRVLSVSAAIFAVVGALMFVYGLNAFFLSRTDPTHWDWLTAGDHFAYFARHWRWVGVVSMGLGAQTVVVALTAFRRAERWAWWTLWYWPAVALLGLVEYPWSGIFFGPLAVILAAALVLPAREFFGGIAGASPLRRA